MPIAAVSTIEYPESDGKPMGETDLHRDAMFRHIELLKRFYQGQKVYVSGDLLLFFEEGNPKKFIVPDAFIVKGLTQQRRRSYKLWEERITPQLVIETTSKKTKKRDLEVKPGIYAKIGILEYFIYDPTRDYLKPPLQCHRLVNNQYRSIKPESDGSFLSEQLGLRLVIENDELEFVHPETGLRLLTSEEERVNEAEARQREMKARLTADEEVKKLREELRRLRDEK